MTDDVKETDTGIPDVPSDPQADPRPAPRRVPQPASQAPIQAAPPPVPQPASPEFEQLRLDPTIIGPGMRSEDPYEPGARLKIEGQRGTFIYRYATLSKAGLVSLHLTQDGVARAVRPDQVAPLKKRGLRK